MRSLQMAGRAGRFPKRTVGGPDLFIRKTRAVHRGQLHNALERKGGEGCFQVHVEVEEERQELAARDCFSPA